MTKLVTSFAVLIAFIGLLAPSINAYEIPPRKIEIKPYLFVFFPNDLWVKDSQESIVENESSFGLGLKLRTQFSNQFGLVLNASYNRFEVPSTVSNDGVIFTAGGYWQRAFNFGSLTFDLCYGIIIAADEVLALLMPSLEYSYSISDRVSIAIDAGLPIPNDWPKDYGYEEKLGSFTLSVGTIFLF